MAVIFFEGFNRVNSFFAGVNWQPIGNSVPTAFFGAPGTSRIARTGAAAFLTTPQGVGYTAVGLPEGVPVGKKLYNIGNHSNKKLYFGFAFSGWATDSNSGLGRRFLRFNDSSNNELVTLHLAPATSAPMADLFLFVRKNNNLISTYRLPQSVIFSLTGTTTNSPAVAVTYVPTALSSSVGTGSSYQHFECELDLVANTFACKVNNQVMLTTANAVNTSVTLGTVSSIDIHYGIAPGFFAGGSFDDFVLVDDTDSFANTWMGRDARVYPVEILPAFNSPLVSTPADNEWVAVGTPNSAVTSGEDGDSSYFRSAGPGSTQMFATTTITPDPTNAAIAGIRFNASARNINVPAAYEYVYRSELNNTSVYALDTPAVTLTTASYSRDNSFSIINPATGARWTPSQINNGMLGVRQIAAAP